MSFSSDIKGEVARVKVNEFEVILAELAGLVRMCGRLNIKSMEEFTCSFATENAAIARRIFTFLKRYYFEGVSVYVSKNTQLKKNSTYWIEMNDSASTKLLLDDVKFIKDENVFTPFYPLDRSLIQNLEARKGYIRGSFLGAGSVSNPEKTYHLEFVTEHEEHAIDLSEIINSFGLHSKVAERKDNYIVYIKEGEQVSDLLSILGANQGVLKFEDVRVVKDMRNQVNRVVNCETANLSKTINASMRQIRDIETIETGAGLDSLPEILYSVAILRKENPDLSLKEIGELMNPPIGKSGVNHRFKKIEKIAKGIRGGKE